MGEHSATWLSFLSSSGIVTYSLCTNIHNGTGGLEVRKSLLLFSFILVLSTMAGGCGKTTKPTPSQLILATTTSTYDTGLLNYLVPVFEEKHPYKIRVISLGTGQALNIAKNGDADVVLVHDRETELQMVEQGHFVDRVDVMYNDFVLEIGRASCRERV